MNGIAAFELYDKLRLAPDETARARLIAEAFMALETRYPHLDDLVTAQQLTETELRLRKEIEQVRLQIKETELKIEQVRTELKESELKLTKEIEQVRFDLTKEIEQVRAELKIEIEKVHSNLKVEIARSHTGLLKWSFLFWLTQFGAIGLLLWRLWGLPAG